VGKRQISPLLPLPYKNFGKIPWCPLEKIFPTPMFAAITTETDKRIKRQAKNAGLLGIKSVYVDI